METIVTILQLLGSLSPVGVIALLAVVIYLLVRGETAADKKVELLTNNHLHEVTDALARMENTLKTINDNIVHIKARINGRD